MKGSLPSGVLLGTAILVLSAARAQVTETPIAPIKTDGGLVAGKILSPGVKAWLGVPYAKPPVNDLRWAPPQPISWKGVWTADRKMPECMQPYRAHDINNYFGEEAESEDCLYLNIWAPQSAAAGANLPVIVFIYGGGFTIGSTGMALYGGENIARKGAIFVNMGYRLGILGWMAHPELTKEQGGHSGNYGYLDQNAALKWVQDNIARFGGDPHHVLITGQSAGAASVSAQIDSPLSKGLFQSAMMSSACSISSPPGSSDGTSLAKAEQTGLEVQMRIGAPDLQHMRYYPADKIVALQAPTDKPAIRTGPITDGYFTTKSMMDMAKSHEMSDIPIIASFNSGESSIPLQRAKTVEEYKKIATQMYGKDVDAFLALYPVTTDSEIPAVSDKVARESGIAYRSRDCGVLQESYNKSKAYVDMFDRKHPYIPSVTISDQNTATIGAYHNGDSSYWFENLDAFNLMRKTRDWTAWDHTLADDMSDSLIAFAKTGNPSTAAVKWPAWSSTSDVFVDFGDTIRVEKFDSKGMEWLAKHPAQGGGPGLLSESGR
jgi:para-nitrobenzyl esterase